MKDNTKQFLPSVLVIVAILLSVFYCILEMEQARDSETSPEKLQYLPINFPSFLDVYAFFREV